MQICELVPQLKKECLSRGAGLIQAGGKGPSVCHWQELQLILDASGKNPWSVSRVRLKAALVAGEAVEVHLQDRWHLPYLRSLLSQRRHAHSLALEEEETRLTELIDGLVAN